MLFFVYFLPIVLIFLGLITVIFSLDIAKKIIAVPIVYASSLLLIFFLLKNNNFFEENLINFLIAVALIFATSLIFGFYLTKKLPDC
ncbi:MAG: hypothetical protein EBT55_00825 [Proteobacteria bacterium]|jgi:hypothetical protein|nr:hypothetical protein [Pseudomonadota bacterium]